MVEKNPATGTRTRRSPRSYEIRVRGAIGPTLLEAFPTLRGQRLGQDTVLVGALPDPAALYGVIHELELLALELLEVRSAASVDGASGITNG